MATEAVTEKDSIIYSVGRVLVSALLRVFLPVKYHGKEKIRDRETPFVLISNHRHALDPLILALPIPSQCVFLAKKELAKNRLAEKFLLKFHCIFVDRHNMDMEAMRACMKAVRMKKVLVIFPEGTRHHEGQMEQIENGTSLIVMRSRAPLVPVYLDAPLRFFRRVNAYVGDDIPYEDLLSRGINVETCGEMNERMRETYRKMVREHG